MTTFKYGKPAKRAWRKGVVLAHADKLLQDVCDLAKRLSGDDAAEIFRIYVAEIHADNNVLLEIWVKDKLSLQNLTKSTDITCTPQRVFQTFRVVRVQVAENAKWPCELRIGRGYVEEKPKKAKK
jgi:hypothetical protein